MYTIITRNHKTDKYNFILCNGLVANPDLIVDWDFELDVEDVGQLMGGN